MWNLKERLVKLNRPKRWLCAIFGVTALATMLTVSMWSAYSQSEGWMDVDNWDRFEKGMCKEEVRDILGEPRSRWRFLSGGEIWRYEWIIPHKNDRMVSFNSEGKLTGRILPSFWMM